MLAKYAGGKGACADQILRYRPPVFGEFRDPLCGNCPFIWHTEIISPSMPRWVNDLDVCVYRYWDALLNDLKFGARLHGMIWPQVHSATRIHTQFLRNIQLVRREQEPAAWLFVKRMSHRQITHLTRPNVASFSLQELNNGCASLRTLSRERVQLAQNIVRGICTRDGSPAAGIPMTVTNCDYWEVMSAPPKTDKPICILCDIPYRTESHGSAFYGHWFSEQDHADFFDRVMSLDRRTHKVLLTLDWTCPSHEQWRLSKWSRPPYLWTFGRYDLPRGMSSNAARQTKNELVVCNYDPIGD